MCAVFLCPQVMFQAPFRESQRLLSEHAEKLQRGQLLKEGAFDEDLHKKVAGRVGVLLQVNIFPGLIDH